MLDADLLAFVRSSIRSTWALELLLLLRKKAPQRFTGTELVLELRATNTLISACVSQLQAVGLISCDANGACSYAPASPALADATEALARAYEERPMTVINAIVATPNERLKSFADAFRFSKKDQ